MAGEAEFRVAIVGAGGMAGAHAQAFADIPGVRLVGIAGRTRARAEALALEFGIAVTCDDVDELFRRTQADLVVVTTPELATREVAIACFAFPWAVLLEKPAGYDLADARAIGRAAKAASARVWVALNRRHHAATLAALDDLANDPAPRFIQIFDQEAPDAARAAGQPELVVENWMYANAVHMVDYAPVFGRGPIIAVDPVLPWRPDRPGAVVARISFASGDEAIYQAIWNGPGPWACAVGTPRRRWEMRPLERAVFQNAGDRTLHSVEPHPWDGAFKPGLRLQAERMVRAARGEATTAATLEDSTRTMRLVAAIYGHEAWGGET